MPKEPTKYRAPALDKGLDIIELLAAAPAALSIAEISEGVGRSRGEIFRMLQVLEERDYIARDEGDGSYAITRRLFRLGMEQPPVKNVVETALPVMHRLAGEIEQSCHLVVPSGEQIVVVARIDPPGDIGLVVRVGHRRPMAQATSGLVLLAWQGDAVRDRWLDIVEAHDDSVERKGLLRRLTKIREKGYASAPSHVVGGVTDLSAPIVEHGHAVCALTVPFIAREGSAVDMAMTVNTLCKAAADISGELG
jgi:DNA-binding IclR family transcriptional regulator